MSHDNTVEVTNRFKGLDQVDRVLEELWTEIHNTVQVQFSSVAKSCLSLCDPMGCSTSGLPVYH